MTATAGDGDGDAAMAADASLRRALSRGEALLGTFCIVPSTEVVESVALAGFDVVVLDMEHGPFSLETVRTCLLAAKAHGLLAVVRVQRADPALIGAVLDIGADGVLVPQVSTAAAAASVVSAARFAPQGTRGANPWVRAAGYSGDGAWFDEANRTVAVMVMIEGSEGLEAIEEILGVPGLDAVFLGPVDMSHSLGVPGQTDHPRVTEALERVVHGALRRGVATAVFAPDADRARTWRSLGVTLIALGVDAAFIRSSLERAADSVRSASMTAQSRRSRTCIN